MLTRRPGGIAADSDSKYTPRRTTLAEIRNLAVIPVWSKTKPNAAGLLDLNMDTAYNEARSGRLPTIKVSSRLYRVPVPALLRWLGADSDSDDPGQQ